MYISYIVYDIYSYIYIIRICDTQQIGFYLQTLANMWIFTSAAFNQWTFAKTWDGDCLWQTVIIPYRTWRFGKGGWKNSDQLFWLASQKHCNMDPPNSTQWLLCWGKNLGRTFFGGIIGKKAPRCQDFIKDESQSMEDRQWVWQHYGTCPCAKNREGQAGTGEKYWKVGVKHSEGSMGIFYLRGSPGRLHIYGVVQPNGWRITVEYSPAWLLNLDGVCGEIMHIYIYVYIYYIILFLK